MLMDNGVPFTPQAHPFLPGGHRFDRVCWEYGVAHRLTKPAHPWTTGPVERMNRTIKEATIQRFHCQTTQQHDEHPQAFCWPTITPNGSRRCAASPPPRIYLCDVAKQPHYLCP